MGLPARGPGNGSPAAPPFDRDNMAALKHGATTPRIVNPLAQQLCDDVLSRAEPDGMPWLQTLAFRPALEAWARHEARVLLLTRYLEQKSTDANAGGMLDDDDVRPATDLLIKFESAAANARARLGLDPVAAARLGRDTAGARVDMARLMALLSQLDGGDQEDHDDDA